MLELKRLLLLLLLASPLLGQNQTTVTGTLVDPNGIAYYPATVIACLSPVTLNPKVAGNSINLNQGTNYCIGPVNTTRSGFFQMALYTNASIVPASTIWVFTVAAAGTPPPGGNGPLNFSSAGVTISGTSQDVSANINSVGPAQSPSSGGTGTFKNLNSIRFADQFAGADCGAKINAADVDLGASGGEIWVNLNCGTTWATPITLSASHVLRFLQYGFYTAGGVITLNTHSGIMCDGPQIGSIPACELAETNGANLPALIVVANGADGAFVRDIHINGQRGPGNLTAGVCIKVDRAKRFSIEDSAIYNCQTHGVWFHSTGLNSESGDPKIFRSFFESNTGDGIYIENTADGFISDTEAGGNGLITGAFGRPLVNTTNTTITYASGGFQTGWSTDSSLVGTMLRVNDAIRCQVLAIPSTTTITVSATQCWNNSGTATALGTLTGVPLNWGNGYEFSGSPTWRINHGDHGQNATDGILQYSFAGGLLNGEMEITGGNQFGGNCENAIEVIGYDTVGGVISVSGDTISGNVINGGAPCNTAVATWSGILLVDPQGVTLTGNTFSTSPSPQLKYAISSVESASTRAGIVQLAANVINTQGNNFATATYGDTTTNGAMGFQVPMKVGGGNLCGLDLFDVTAGAATPHYGLKVGGGNLTILTNNCATAGPAIDSSGDIFFPAAVVGNTAGQPLGTASVPWGIFWLGTAATNNFKFQPATTTGARTWVIPDWGANGSSTQNQPFVITLTSQYTNSTTTFSNVAGGNTIQFAVAANSNYTATCHLYYQAAATGGLNIEFTGPASPTAVRYGMDLPTAVTGVASGEADAFGTSIGAVSTAGAVNLDAMVSFSLLNGANAGTVNLLAKSSAAVQLQIQSGSYCQIQ